MTSRVFNRITAHCGDRRLLVVGRFFRQRIATLAIAVPMIVFIEATPVGAQLVEPAGVRAATAITSRTGQLETIGGEALAGRVPGQFSEEPGAAFTVGYSRQTHVVIGLISGLLVGASTGAIIGNSNAKRCRGESCQVSAALGSGFDIVLGAAGGALLGIVVGALWPVHD